MRVKNRKCIRRLSFKSLWASRKRNIIAICAIALTTLMFTSLFTIMLSVNSSYETYNFRQAGGYSDGSFKDLSREQADKIAAHKGIKASGERIVCGFSSSDVFGKVAAEVSYMDKNCTKWSYATPTTGKEPQKENEIAMDTTALRLLGVEPKLGTNVTITYQAGNGTDTGIPQTDSFILVGYWEYDDLMPVHYINVSKAYVDKINEKCIAAGDEALDIDLNVMLPSKLNIREQMEKIDTDLGYDWNTRDQENSARIGVNWGLTASSVSSDIDFSLVPNTLSGGQQQRVAIARALAARPAIILADEPTGNLDSKTELEVISMLKSCVSEYGQTLVMITHDETIAQMADRMIVIEDGKVVRA